MTAQYGGKWVGSMWVNGERLPFSLACDGRGAVGQWLSLGMSLTRGVIGQSERTQTFPFNLSDVSLCIPSCSAFHLSSVWGTHRLGNQRDKDAAPRCGRLQYYLEYANDQRHEKVLWGDEASILCFSSQTNFVYLFQTPIPGKGHPQEIRTSCGCVCVCV